jgi:kynureninase
MRTFTISDNSRAAAHAMDANDSLGKYRDEFYFPNNHGNQASLYFAGHSLGLQPKKARDYVNAELDTWATYAVDGHFYPEKPWLHSIDYLNAAYANLLGASEEEVILMNGLTVNVHLMLVSFYRPTKQRNKILIEANSFPSDNYAVQSQIRFHGFDPKEALVEIQPEPESLVIDPASILHQIEEHKDSLALVFLGNANYLSGQAFDMAEIVRAAHKYDIVVGFDLAHGAGNLLLELGNTGTDFAVWCTYKYLNSGPGSLSGCYINKQHLSDPAIPRFEGWWGTDKSQRFQMKPEFDAVQRATDWQLCNPPVLMQAAMRASVDLFTEATMPALRAKGDLLTSYLEFLLLQRLKHRCIMVTPPLPHRGSMLCFRLPGYGKELITALRSKGVTIDFREPDIFRIAPAPLYNSFEDVFGVVEIIEGLITS